MKKSTAVGREGFKGLYDSFRQRARDRHARHYRDSDFHLWADLVLAGLIIGLIITTVWLLVWQPRPEFMVSARLEEAKVTSGQLQTFIISYANGEAVPAAGASISLVLPKHFMFQSAEPAELFDSASSSFSLGDLPKGAKGQLSVTGIIIGEPSERQSIELSAMYQTANVKKRLLDSFSYTIDASSLELSLTIPDRAYQSADFRGSVTVKNSSEATLRNIQVSFPAKDITVMADASTNANNSFDIAEISGGETKMFEFNARSSSLGEMDLKAEVYINADTELIRQSSTSKRVTISEPNLKLRASLREQALAAVGSKAMLELAFENLESAPVTDLQFSLRPSRPAVTIRSVEVSEPSFARAETISYGKDIPAKGKGSITATLSLDRSSVNMEDSSGLSVIASYMINGEKYEYALSAGNLRFNSNLTLQSGGYYYGPQGDQLGVGPVPPRVGIPTTYWIIWQVNNLGNDVKNMQVTADLPEALAWVDQKSLTSGTIDFSPVSRRIVWSPGDIAKGGGNYRASFAISLVPRSGDLGKVPELLKDIRFNAVDSFTGATLTQNLPIITANIESDRLSSGKGTVLPLE